MDHRAGKTVRGKLLTSVVAPLLALGVTLLFRLTPAGEIFALKAGDLQRQLFADRMGADPRIVLVEVDQTSLDHFERDNIAFPWPRSLYNPLIGYCIKGGARAVLFDILFNNLSPYGEETDAEFAGAIRAAGKIWLAADFPASTGGGEELEARLGLPPAGSPPPALVRRAASLPLPALRDAASGIGAVSFRPDADGVYRRVPPGIVYGGLFIPALAAAPLAAGASAVRFEPGRLLLGDLAVPLDGKGAMLLRYHGRRGAGYRHYPAAAVITSALATAEGRPPTVPEEAFRDAYVLVGYSAPGLYDLKPTPLSSLSPGFEIHAAALDNLLHRDWLREAPGWASAGIGCAAAMAIAAAVIFLPVYGTAIASAAVAAILLTVCGAAYRAGLLLDLWSIAVAALLALIGASVWRYRTEGKQRRYYAAAFSRYVSPKVVRQILEDPKRLELGGEKRLVTLFFSDLQGFTSISERMGPQELVAFLNRYTTVMADVITGFDGTIDKFIGDAVMAFWGAPLEQPDQARRALLAALECQERLRPFGARLLAEGGPHPVTRIGIDTGECVIGNMGSRDRFDYTAIGDTANLASRLEGLNKVYGTLILASESAWRAADGVVFGRLLDRVRVKGKERPVAVYEAMAPAGAATEGMKELQRAYEEAFAAYGGRRWERTLEIAADILGRGDDPPTRLLAGRARGFLAAPPPSDWDGVFTHLAK